MTRKPYYLQKPGKYWQYIITEEKLGYWKALKGILPPELKDLASSKRQGPVDAFMIQYLSDRNEKARVQETVSSQTSFEQFTRNWYVLGKCEWLENQIKVKKKSFKNATIQMKRGHLVNHCWPAFGKEPINKISHKTIERMLADKNLSLQTMQHIIQSLKPIFKKAERDGYIDKDPMRFIDPFKVTHAVKGIFTLAEYRTLWPEDMEGLLRVWQEFRIAFFYRLKATSGMRLGEVVAAKWEQFDWQVNGFDLCRAVDSDRKVSVAKRESITQIEGSGRRFILLPRSTIAMAQAWRNMTPYPADSDFIFFGVDPGQPADKDNIQRKFRPALERAGISLEGRKLTPHSLRHTYKTILHDRISKFLLDLMLGHKNEMISAMDKIYLHKSAREKVLPFIGERDKIDEVFDYRVI